MTRIKTQNLHFSVNIEQMTPTQVAVERGQQVLDRIKNRVCNVIFDDDEFQTLTHRLVTQQLGVPENTLLGDVNEDGEDGHFYQGHPVIYEDDPRYERYWDLYCVITNKVLAQIVADDYHPMVHDD